MIDHPRIWLNVGLALSLIGYICSSWTGDGLGMGISAAAIVYNAHVRRELK